MHPTPRAGLPGASAPNMSGRIRPQKHTAAATMPPLAQPITDPFAFGRAQPPMAAGGLPTIPNCSPPQMQTPPNTTYSQLGSGLPPQPQLLENVPGALAGPPPPSLPGVTLFTPHGTTSPGVFPSPSPVGYASANSEQDYFNSRDPAAAMSTDASHTAPAPSNTLFNQDFQAQHLGHPLPFQPLPLTSSSTQWVPDHSSRPPSVQNYFQPTTDPPARPSNIPPQTQMYPTHSQSPHHNASTPPTHPGHPQSHAPVPLQNPEPAASSLLPDPNGAQQHNSHFQTQGYFSQSSAPHDLWFHQPAQDSGYHQMGTGSGHPLPPTDTAGPPHASNMGHVPASQPGPSSVPASDTHAQESGTISMFFKGSDVENEEMLADERNKALNGVAASFQHNSNLPAQCSHSDLSVDYQGVSVPDHTSLPYMNESSHLSQGHTQKAPDNDFDHVENLECVPNQEVLPNESNSGAATSAPNAVDQFETGPNLETPDSIPRPMRSVSVSSNYSNLSHGSGTGPRRHQGVEGTFIQQESPRLADNPNTSAAAGGYFEQIDTSPGGDAGMPLGSVEHVWHPTPSPPKPTGIFQASANSSFEPVRSHGVGVRPAEVDRAKMVAEGGSDCTSGNFEQPPDNMENIYGPGQAPTSPPADGLPNQTHSVVHPHSRPSSRAFGANRPCESPATTLWAQNEPTSLGANILLAPAAPTVLPPLREPSADVIQPPEDCPLDLQSSQRVQKACQQHSENLENPPKVTKDAQQGVRDVGNISIQTPTSHGQPAPPQAAANTQQMPNESPKTSDSQVALQGQRDAPPVLVSGAQPSHGQYSTPAQGPAAGNAPPPAAPAVYPPGPQAPVPPGVSLPAPTETARPPSSAGSHQSYVHPAPPEAGQVYSGYYGNYGEYPDSRGQYPPQPGDPRMTQYYQDAAYRGRADPWYGRYDGQNPGYHDPNYQYRDPQSDRPSSRGSQYSDRPSSRQGYFDDYQRANRNVYAEYYPDYPKHYDYGGYNYGQYDQPYRRYYDHSYWSYYNESYRNGYYNQQYPPRNDDQWQYYPGYDRSFDDDHARGRDVYGDDFDRRSVHSEQSAHSVQSSTSHHSRRSSFSSRSQQSQVYRSQPDLVSAVYDTTQSTLPVDCSYGQYPNQADASQNYNQYPMYPSEYTPDSTWIAPEQPPPRPATPEKFTMPHRCARFGPGGHLIQVLPNLPSAGQPALVEIHNME
ncbi:hypothetical protein AMECASPLE_028602, partial [Ameca splendens]